MEDMMEQFKQFSCLLFLLLVFTISSKQSITPGFSSSRQTPFDNRIIEAIEFRGNQNIPSESILQTMKLKQGDMYDKQKLEVDLDRIRVLLYADKGYIRTRLGQPILENTNHGLRIVIPVDEGHLYRFGNIMVEDSTLLEPDQLLGIIGIKPGDIVKAYSTMQRGLDRLRKQYHNRGYIRFTVSPDIDFRPITGETGEGIVDLTITLEEGEVYIFRKIEFVGNQIMEDRLLRRKVGIKEGSVYSGDGLETAIRRLNSMGLFEKLDSEDYEVYIDDGAKEVDILIKLKEKRH
jgi:outer membrane protein insertion porin family